MSKKSTSPELVPLTLGHWVSFHGSPPEYRVKGVALVRGEEVLAIGGLGFQRGFLYVFMDMVQEAARYPKLLLKGGRRVIEMGRPYGLPLVASREESFETSERFLRRLGFEPDGELWYVGHGNGPVCIDGGESCGDDRAGDQRRQDGEVPGEADAGDGEPERGDLAA